MHLRKLLQLMIVTALAASTTLAGCIDDDSEATDDSEDLQAELGEDFIQTTMTTGALQASFATPARSFNSGGVYSFPFVVADNATGFVFELTWDAEPTTTGGLSLWIQPAGAGNINENNLVDRPAPLVKVSGGSPLHVAMAAEDFPEPGEYEVLVRSGEPFSVSVEQPFTYFFTEFTQVEFDPEFSALAGDESA